MTNKSLIQMRLNESITIRIEGNSYDVEIITAQLMGTLNVVEISKNYKNKRGNTNHVRRYLTIWNEEGE